MTLEPVIVLVNTEDLAYLRSVIDGLPPIPPDAMVRVPDGWTAERLLLGRLLSSVVELHRNGDLQVVAP